MSNDTRRFSSNNPFRGTDHDEQRRQSQAFRPIRPVSNLPVDDAFDYSHYQLDNEQEGFVRDDNNSNSINNTPQLTLGEGFRFENNNSQKRHISFADPKSISNAGSLESSPRMVDDNVDETPQIRVDPPVEQHEGAIDDNTTMKRARWGTQRHKKGRPPKRSKSIFKSRRVSMLSHKGSVASKEPNTTTNSNSNAEDDEQTEMRKIYVNMPLPQSLVDDESGLPVVDYPRNKVRTTKYTPLSFVPKNLFYQFQNIANIYFLFIVILGAFPIFGVANAGMAAVPIIFIVTITAIKDAIEDYGRTVLDMQLNNTPTEILHNNHNFNVTDDNVSLWRRFKKANTRLMLKIGRSLKKSKKTEKSEQEFGHELTRATSVNSTRTTRNSLNPFDDNAASGTVLDYNIQTPGKAKFRRDFWKNVRVGDFVRVRNNDEIPADLVVLSTSDADGACYVETKNLDGETNLKVRQALKCGHGIKHAGDCEHAKMCIESEGPQANLYSYNGVAKWDDGQGVEPVTINNVLLRGCSLRNTEWVIGIAVFTGTETKIMKNAGETPTKRSQISRELNISVLYNFGLLFVLCFASGLINGIDFGKSRTSIDYFEFGSIGGSAPVDGLVTFWAAVILYQSLVPISLYISIEIVKTVQAFFIFSDCWMYYEPIDYPCTPKSWNISDDLGQIEYIFSDKTGTLTQNVMEFKKCSINGMAYGKAYTEALAGLRKREGVDVDEEGVRMAKEIATDKQEMIKSLRDIDENDQLVDEEVSFVSSKFVQDLQGEAGKEQEDACKHFMLLLALCHSVITEPSTKYPERLDFKAQSPDEAALVGTARDMGFTFVERTQRGMVINVQGEDQEIQILNTMEFNSTRKRMSAIVKLQDKIYLVCKGADSVIYSRLRAGEQERLRQETALHLEQFAQEGLRTLCLAQRELNLQEYTEFNRQHEEASAAMTNREERMEEVADAIEQELTLLGGTAIEDRLQDGVPQSISHLGQAGIKLWVLTGDKVETAINIGFSCNLLDNDMELLIIRVEDGNKATCDKLISDYLQRFNLQGTEEELEEAKKDHSPPRGKFAIVIDGDALKLTLDDSIKRKFLLLAKQCKSVLCCRVSPAQKAAVVTLVKTELQVMTLSIGDGANDVAMIQAAEVGIGVAGEEGRQAVMSSDYAVGQFRFLTRLLLVHGRWSYRRLAEMIPNFYYKNCVFTLTLFWYGVFSSFDGSYLYEYTFVMLFNVAFTSLPVIFMGILDQDVDAKLSLEVPELYQRGILRLDWHMKKFWIYMCDGIYQSVISFFFPYLCYHLGLFESPTGKPLNHRFWMGIGSCSISVFSCNIYVLSNQMRWDWVSVLINVISCLLVYAWTGIYSSFTSSKELYGLANEVFASCVYWAVTVVGIVVCLLPHYAWLSVQKMFLPLDIDIIREKLYLGDYDDVIEPEKADDKSSSTLSPEPPRKKWSRKKQADEQAETLFVPALHHSTSYAESFASTDAGSLYGTKPANLSYEAPPMPQVSTEPSDHHHRQGQSLDQVRRSLRMEQPPPRESLDRIRTSMDLDWTTADNLMRMSGEGRRNFSRP